MWVSLFTQIDFQAPLKVGLDIHSYHDHDPFMLSPSPLYAVAPPPTYGVSVPLVFRTARA